MKFRQSELTRIIKKVSIIITVIISLVILTSSCSKERSTVQHFTKSINYANEATRLRNKGGPYESMDPNDAVKMHIDMNQVHIYEPGWNGKNVTLNV